MATTLLSPEITAKRIATSVRNLQNLERKGEAPPSIRIGKLRRYPEDRLDEWIESKITAAGRSRAA